MELPRDRDPTAMVKSDFSLSSRGIWSIGFQSDGVGNSWKNTTIAVRSSLDRGSFRVESIHDHQSACAGESGARSTLDRGPIVVDRDENRS